MASQFPSNAGMADVFVGKSKESRLVEQVEAQIKALAQATYPDTQALITQLGAMGVPVFAECSDFQSKIVYMSVGGAFGFVPPINKAFDEMTGFLKKHFPSFEGVDLSHGFIMLPKHEANYANLIFLAYHALAYRIGLEGYDDRARKLFATFNRKHKSAITDQFADSLDLEEMTLLRWAIRREKEGILLLSALMNEVFIPKNNAKRFTQGVAEA